MTNKYSVEFFWSEEDEGFIAVVPDLPGCSAFGETRAEAAAEIEGAIAAWIEAAASAGNPVPNPSVRASFDDCSGRLLLRMPKELHFDLQRGAREQGISLNSYTCYLLTKKHYHADAVAQLGKSLQWQSIVLNHGHSTMQVHQLSSVNRVFSTLGTTVEEISTPVAGIGVLTNG